MNFNLIFLSLIILIIQLNVSICLKGEDLILEIDNVTLPESSTDIRECKKISDVKSLTFSSSKCVKICGKNIQQLRCNSSGERKKLCNKYNGTSAVCENENYEIEDKAKWKCKLSGMKVTNKNVMILASVVVCQNSESKCDAMRETNYTQCILPSHCKMWYVLDKDGKHDPKDDEYDSKKGIEFDLKNGTEFNLNDDEVKEKDELSTRGIVIVVLIALGLVFACFICFWVACLKKHY